MKVGLILCKCFITYPNSVSVLISWIINEFEMHVYQLFWWCGLFYRWKPKLKFLFDQYNKFTWTTSCCLDYVSFKNSFKPSKNAYHNPFPIHSPISQGTRGGTNKMKCCTVSTSVPCIACHRLPENLFLAYKTILCLCCFFLLFFVNCYCFFRLFVFAWPFSTWSFLMD